jgi:hypothetical protein
VTLWRFLFRRCECCRVKIPKDGGFRAFTSFDRLCAACFGHCHRTSDVGWVHSPDR